MTGPQLATLATIGWVVLTLAFLIVVGTWSTGGSWTILPGLVRGVHDWATEHAAAHSASSPSPWSVTLPDPAPPALVEDPVARLQPDEAAEMEELDERHLR
jgi:hypothetical protein